MRMSDGFRMSDGLQHSIQSDVPRAGTGKEMSYGPSRHDHTSKRGVIAHPVNARGTFFCVGFRGRSRAGRETS